MNFYRPCVPWELNISCLHEALDQELNFGAMKFWLSQCWAATVTCLRLYCGRRPILPGRLFCVENNFPEILDWNQSKVPFAVLLKSCSVAEKTDSHSPFSLRAPLTTWDILTINELLQALRALAAQYLVFAWSIGPRTKFWGHEILTESVLSSYSHAFKTLLR